MLAGPELAVPPRPRAASGNSYRPDIEGLRGIAVLLVVLYHMRLPGFSGGFVGVDVFFVLSGYLITRLLVAEVDRTGRIDILAFYARRLRRLLPAAAFMLLVVLAAGTLILPPLEQMVASGSAVAAALYASNIRFILSAGNYFAAELESDPFLHTWSLAVEEQFYFVWPVLVAYVLGRAHSTRRLAWTIGSVTVVTAAISIWLTAAEPTWAFFGSPPRAWEFGVGALIGMSSGAVAPRAARVGLGWAGLLAITGTAVVISEQTPFPGFAAFIPVFGTAAVLFAGDNTQDEGVRRALQWSGLQWLGRLSYSLYLWHWPFLVLGLVLFPHAGIGARLLMVAAATMAAIFSYRCIESPIRHSSFLARRRTLTVMGGITATLCLGLVAVLFRSSAAQDSMSARFAGITQASKDRYDSNGCAAWTGGERLSSCDEVDGSRPLIAIFGDSHAGQWVPALVKAASDRGWALLALTKDACPSVDVPIDPHRKGARFVSECNAWREQALDAIARLQPAVVLVANSREHVEGPRRKDSRMRVSPDRWASGAHAVLQRIASSGSSVIVIRDTPRLGHHVPGCLALAEKQSSWRESSCDSPRHLALDDVVFEAERRAARGLDVDVVDLSDRFCDSERCYAIRDGRVVFSDADHITTAWSVKLSAALQQHIHRVLAARPQ